MIEIDVSLKGRPVRSYRFEKGPISIGRDPQSDIHLDNPGVSRRHAQIVQTGNRFEVLDVGSSNGTFVNGMPASERTVGDGDVIQVGKFALRVSLKTPAQRQEPALDLDRFQGTIVLSGDDAGSAQAVAAPPVAQRATQPRTRKPQQGKTQEVRTAKVTSSTPGATRMLLVAVMTVFAFAAGYAVAQFL